MREALAVCIGQPVGGFFEESQCLCRFEFLADPEKVAQVASLDKVHHDVVLAGGRIAIDGMNPDDVGVLQADPNLALALEEFDFAGVLRPALAKHLDCNNLSRAGIVRSIDAAEAAGGNSIQQPVAAQKVAVRIALDEFGPLPRGQIPFTLQSASSDSPGAVRVPNSDHASMS